MHTSTAPEHSDTKSRRLAPCRYRVVVSEAVNDPHARADAAATAAWVAGEEQALRLAWDRFGPMVFTYCLRRLNDRDAASDCVQEVFVSAWRSRDRFDPSAGTLPGWLMGIAKFRVVDAFRKAERVPAPVADPPEQPAASSGGDHADQLADRMLVSRAVATLPDRARAVVKLAFWSDMSQSEIADELGLPLGTVKSDMRRGLARMRDHLDDEASKGGGDSG